MTVIGLEACKPYDNIGGTVKKPHFKVGILRNDYAGSFPPKEENYLPERCGNIYSHQKGQGIERLYVGVAEKQHKELILALAKLFSPPYFFLYVLHTSRCGNELARYQSPPLEYDSVVDFFRRFEDFIAGDSRHDLWLASPGDKVTIVWDRHDVLFMYGPLDKIEPFLESRGFSKGMPLIAVSPHIHFYRPEYDQEERDILKYFSWRKSPLQDIDLQTGKD